MTTEKTPKLNPVAEAIAQYMADIENAVRPTV